MEREIGLYVSLSLEYLCTYSVLSVNDLNVAHHERNSSLFLLQSCLWSTEIYITLPSTG